MKTEEKDAEGGEDTEGEDGEEMEGGNGEKVKANVEKEEEEVFSLEKAMEMLNNWEIYARKALLKDIWRIHVHWTRT